METAVFIFIIIALRYYVPTLHVAMSTLFLILISVCFMYAYVMVLHDVDVHDVDDVDDVVDEHDVDDVPSGVPPQLFIIAIHFNRRVQTGVIELFTFSSRTLCRCLYIY